MRWWSMWKPATYREMIQYQVFVFVMSVLFFAWWWFGDPKSPQHGKILVAAIFGSVMFVLHGFRLLGERRRQ